jgi:hypothetical protein
MASFLAMAERRRILLEAVSGGRWLGGEAMRLVRWLGGEAMRLVRWLGGQAMRLVRWLGGQAMRLLRWFGGQAMRLLRWFGGQALRLLRWLRHQAMRLAKWIRHHAVAISVVALALDTAAATAACVYILTKSGLQPGLGIALIGDVIAGSAGAIGIVAAVVAAATYATTVGAPELSVRIRIGPSNDVVPTEQGVTLPVRCEAPANGLRKLVEDALFGDVDMFITISNSAEYTATNTVCRVQLQGLTGVPREQSGWSLVAPGQDWARAYEWAERERSLITDWDRALPAIALAGASIKGRGAKMQIAVQAERGRRKDFLVTLRPS